jgi:hypothetical protein
MISLFSLTLFVVYLNNIVKAKSKIPFKYANPDEVCPILIHIPKTGGTSIRQALQKASYLTRHTELCFNELYENDRFVLSFFRAPRAQVFAQYMECAYDDFGKTATQYFKEFPRNESLVEGFTSWVTHFNQTFVTDTNPSQSAFNCYHPYNMQSRAMSDTCKDPLLYYRDVQTNMAMQTAIRNIDALSFVGITDLWYASMCMMWHFLGKEEQVRSSCLPNNTYTFVHDDHHHAPYHNQFNIPQSTWEMVDAMTTYDLQTYKYALRRFAYNVDLFENRTGILIDHLLRVNKEFLFDIALR